MSTAYSSASSGGRRSRWELRTGHFFRRMAERFKAHRDRKITITELSALDDRILKDIGVPRSEINAVVDERFHERMREFDEQWSHMRFY